MLWESENNAMCVNSHSDPRTGPAVLPIKSVQRYDACARYMTIINVVEGQGEQ